MTSTSGTRRVMSNFTAGAMGGKSIRSSALPPPVDAEEPAPSEESDEVPQGTIAEIMSWVGSDKDRAQRARDAEVATGQPRSTLITQLDQVSAS
jgi:hypothetical protein